MVDIAQTQVAYTPQHNVRENSLEEPATQKEFSFFGDDGMSFWDFVDIVNPLQHLPLISTVYRDMTGDEIDPGARLAGGTLYGGPIGLAASTFNVVLEHNTGKDAGEHVMAWFDGEEQDVPNDQTQIAQNGASPIVSGFAPIIPESEAEAFAAGEASLRMADLEEFMNPDIATEVPVTATTTTPTSMPGAGSAGIWAPPLNQDHPFPTERPGEKKSFTTSQNPTSPDVIDQMQVARHVVSETQQKAAFQAKQTHEESLDALRAFARDVQAQQAHTAQPTAQFNATPLPVLPPQPPATRTSQLSQTQDNDWFTRMMDENLDRYDASAPSG